MNYVNLRGHAYVNGVLRSPSEGTLHLTDEEAKRLVDAELADDVSEDFADVEAAADAPAEHITTNDGKPKGKAAGKEA